MSAEKNERKIFTWKKTRLKSLPKCLEQVASVQHSHTCSRTQCPSTDSTCAMVLRPSRRSAHSCCSRCWCSRTARFIGAYSAARRARLSWCLCWRSPGPPVTPPAATTGTDARGQRTRRTHCSSPRRRCWCAPRSSTLLRGRSTYGVGIAVAAVGHGGRALILTHAEDCS